MSWRARRSRTAALFTRQSRRPCRAITPSRAAAAALDGVIARHGRLDCLVNNAAVRDRRALHDIAPGDLRRLLETNLVAAYELSRLAARHMEARQLVGGHEI